MPRLAGAVLTYMTVVNLWVGYRWALLKWFDGTELQDKVALYAAQILVDLNPDVLDTVLWLMSFIW